MHTHMIGYLSNSVPTISAWWNLVSQSHSWVIQGASTWSPHRSRNYGKDVLHAYAYATLCVTLNAINPIPIHIKNRLN